MGLTVTVFSVSISYIRWNTNLVLSQLYSVGCRKDLRGLKNLVGLALVKNIPDISRLTEYYSVFNLN